MKKLVVLAVLILALSASIAGAANLTMAADNAFWAYLNPTAFSTFTALGFDGGTLNVFDGANLTNYVNPLDPGPASWNQSHTASGLSVKDSGNTLYVYAANWTTGYDPSGNPAGVLAKMTGDASFVSNNSWEYWVSTGSVVDPLDVTNVWRPAFSMGAFPTTGPWNGSVAGFAPGNGAEWLWSGNTLNQASYGDFDQRIWLRKSFNAVPEASTLIGFGSALLMAGPGMIGWLRRRRS